MYNGGSREGFATVPADAVQETYLPMLVENSCVVELGEVRVNVANPSGKKSGE